MESFDLLNFINDDNLIATLGLTTPVSVTDDNCAKLLGSDANTYADLIPSATHLPTSYGEYYTIDTEASGHNISDSVSPTTPLPNEINTTPPIVLTDAVSPISTPAWDATPPWGAMQERSVIIVSSAEDENDTPVSITFQDSMASPANIEPASTSPLLNISTTNAQVGVVQKPLNKKPRRRKEKKVKVYEIEEELADPVQEKKRQNAINAKKNRDKKKNMLKELGEKVSAVTKERDELRKEIDKLKEREQALRQQLQAKYSVSLPTF